MHWAADKGNKEIIQALLAHKNIKVDIRDAIPTIATFMKLPILKIYRISQTFIYRLPFQYALRKGNFELAEILSAKS